MTSDSDLDLRGPTQFAKKIYGSFCYLFIPFIIGGFGNWKIPLILGAQHANASASSPP